MDRVKGWEELAEPLPIYHAYGPNSPCGQVAKLTVLLGDWPVNGINVDALRNVDGTKLNSRYLATQMCDSCGRGIHIDNWMQQFRQKRIPDPDPFRTAMRTALARHSKATAAR